MNKDKHALAGVDMHSHITRKQKASKCSYITRTIRNIFVALFVFQSSTAFAHTVWLEPSGQEDVYDVLFGGHGGKLVDYNPDKLQSIVAFNAEGISLPVERIDKPNSSQLKLLPQTAMIAVYFDNGIWSKDRMGKSVNKPMSQVTGAKKATKAVKYHKTVFDWSSIVLDSIGQEFEVIPLTDVRPVAGEAFSVKVLLNGKPLEDVLVSHGEKGKGAKTNPQGVAEFIPTVGFNKLWAGKRFQVEQKDYTELSYEYLFGFYAR